MQMGAAPGDHPGAASASLAPPGEGGLPSGTPILPADRPAVKPPLHRAGSTREACVLLRGWGTEAAGEPPLTAGRSAGN